MTFSKEFIEIFEYLGEKIGITIDWSSKNVIPYLQGLCTKLVNYELWTSIAWITIMTLIIITLIIIAIKDDDDFWVFAIFVSFFCLIIIGFQSFDIIECIVFPEKTIYEYLKYVIK